MFWYRRTFLLLEHVVHSSASADIYPLCICVHKKSGRDAKMLRSQTAIFLSVLCNVQSHLQVLVFHRVTEYFSMPPVQQDRDSCIRSQWLSAFCNKHLQRLFFPFLQFSSVFFFKVFIFSPSSFGINYSSFGIIITYF